MSCDARRSYTNFVRSGARHESSRSMHLLGSQFACRLLATCDSFPMETARSQGEDDGGRIAARLLPTIAPAMVRPRRRCTSFVCCPTAACIRRRFSPNRHRLCFCVAWGEGSRVRFRSFHRVTAMRRPANCRTSLCLFDPSCLHSLFVIPSLARALTRTARTTTGEDYCALAAVFCRLTRQNHPAQCCTSLPAVLPCRSFAPSSPALAVRVSARPRGKSHEQHACDDGGGITA